MTFCNKRLLKEISILYNQQNNKEHLLDNDYLIYHDDSNINKIYAIIKGVKDSVYKHKFLQFIFDIPENYPYSPPKVTFINYDGVRIHPNFYEDGKCCSTILNTWPSEGEKWSSSMGIETILLMFHSFLDNNPYTYEPGGHDEPTYTEYVLFQSWKTCLLKYIDVGFSNPGIYPYGQPEIFTEFINLYIIENFKEIFLDLMYLEDKYPFGNYFTPHFEIDNYTIDYKSIYNTLNNQCNFIFSNGGLIKPITDKIDLDFKCNICFDTNFVNEINKFITLNCGHTFHKECIRQHITVKHESEFENLRSNGNICSMCRTPITKKILNTINLKRNCDNLFDGWIINPETKRRVKIGSRTYNRLIQEKIVCVIDTHTDPDNVMEL
jgi:ubiquitin-protein ligase